jgi:hypothetical protein
MWAGPVNAIRSVRRVARSHLAHTRRLDKNERERQESGSGDSNSAHSAEHGSGLDALYWGRVYLPETGLERRRCNHTETTDRDAVIEEGRTTS